MPPFSPLPGYSRLRVVTSFDALVTTPLAEGINAVCWQRDLAGDFDEVVRLLALDGDLATIDDARLLALPVSAAGHTAVRALLDDQERLRALGHCPSLECVREYARDDDREPVPTDVYSFHVDRATAPTETFLCTYCGPASEGLRNDEAQRRVDVVAVRARLLADFGGGDGDDFRVWLREHCFDLHYAPLPTAQPFGFGVGNLWRLAVEHAGSLVPACIHRAPATPPGQAPRLLLIS